MGKSGPPCTVCNHKEHHLIDYGLVAGTPLRVLGKRFGLSHYAIGRHGRAHLTAVQRAAILAAQRPEAVDLDAMRARESEGLLAGLVGQRARLLQQGDLAMQLHDVGAAVRVEGAITANYALVAKLLGQLVQRHEVTHTNLLVSPDYLAMRTVLMRALRPFPDAARAVAAELQRMEADAAKDITDAAAAKRPATIEHDPTPPMRAEPVTILPPPPPCPLPPPPC